MIILELLQWIGNFTVSNGIVGIIGLSKVRLNESNASRFRVSMTDETSTDDLRLTSQHHYHSIQTLRIESRLEIHGTYRMGKTHVIVRVRFLITRVAC